MRFETMMFRYLSPADFTILSLSNLTFGVPRDTRVRQRGLNKLAYPRSTRVRQRGENCFSAK